MRVGIMHPSPLQLAMQMFELPTSVVRCFLPERFSQVQLSHTYLCLERADSAPLLRKSPLLLQRTFLLPCALCTLSYTVYFYLAQGISSLFPRSPLGDSQFYRPHLHRPWEVSLKSLLYLGLPNFWSSSTHFYVKFFSYCWGKFWIVLFWGGKLFRWDSLTPQNLLPTRPVVPFDISFIFGRIIK